MKKIAIVGGNAKATVLSGGGSAALKPSFFVTPFEGIVSALGEFVALLTGGTNKGTDGSDVTFATLFEWVWELVKDEFPGANLYFDDLEAFFADVA